MANRIRVYRVPHSTNVERVALAAGHKGLVLDWVDVDPDDRSAVIAASGQPLVPVLIAGDGERAEVIADSPRILHWLEERYPEPPLLPADPATRAEVEIFCDWFNRVWKRPPNAIDAELARAEPDREAIAGWATELRAALNLFEGLLTGRSYLFGALSLADLTAFPFLKIPVLGVAAGDDQRFHRILVETMPLADGFPALRAWVGRLDALPRA